MIFARAGVRYRKQTMMAMAAPPPPRAQPAEWHVAMAAAGTLVSSH